MSTPQTDPDTVLVDPATGKPVPQPGDPVTHAQLQELLAEAVRPVHSRLYLLERALRSGRGRDAIENFVGKEAAPAVEAAAGTVARKVVAAAEDVAGVVASVVKDCPFHPAAGWPNGCPSGCKNAGA